MADGEAAVLAIDGGNSKTDLALVGWDGTVLASLRGPGASHEDYGIDGALSLLADMIRMVAEKAGIDGADRHRPAHIRVPGGSRPARGGDGADGRTRLGRLVGIGGGHERHVRDPSRWS